MTTATHESETLQLRLSASGAARTDPTRAETAGDAPKPALRRGTVHTSKPSYPPVQSVQRALNILRVLNSKRIASVGDLHEATGYPKPTIVRMLDTLIADNYVARDAMCGGYHVTHKVRDLYSGYEGIAELIEIVRPFAIDLTTRIKWPVALGSFDGDAFAIKFWTGSISPWVHVSKLVGNRPNLITSAMGRAYLAFCPDTRRDEIIAELRRLPTFGPDEEKRHRALLAQVRANGFAMRAPHTEPKRNTTIAMPIRQDDGPPLACVTVSFFKSAIPTREVPERIIHPLREVVAKIEDVIAFLKKSRRESDGGHLAGARIDAFFETGEIAAGF